MIEIDDGIDRGASVERVAEVTDKKPCAKKRPAADTEKMAKIQPPDKKPRSRSPSPGSRVPREVTGDCDALLGSLDWSEWFVLMQRAPAPSKTPGWVKRVNGPGVSEHSGKNDAVLVVYYQTRICETII